MGDTYRVVGTTNGAADIEFGTAGAEYTAVGEIQTASRKSGGDTLELKTRKGNTFCVIYFNDQDECSIDAIWDDDFAVPVRGDAIDLCGIDEVLVMDIEHRWAAGKERGITINAKKWQAVDPSA